MHELTLRQTPEQLELERKQRELAELEAQLLDSELELTTLRAALRDFETLYLQIVGSRYVELDVIEAEIAELQARFYPSDLKAQENATKTRIQAQESAQETSEIIKRVGQSRFSLSEQVKKLYRELAKHIHPDLTTDENERSRRQYLMAEANQAYTEGDEKRLQSILSDWVNSPESVRGDGIAAELVRIIRKMAQVQNRLLVIETEIQQLRQSDLFKLKAKASEFIEQDRNLLSEMATTVENQISEAKLRLKQLKSKRRTK